jgi:hypothetical protein
MGRGLGSAGHVPIVAGRDERYARNGMWGRRSRSLETERRKLGLCGMKRTTIISIHELLLRRNDGSTCVVALASLDGKAFARSMDFYLVIACVAVVAVRHVGQGVLVAGLLSYSRIEPFHGCALDGVIDVAAGVIRVID